MDRWPLLLLAAGVAAWGLVAAVRLARAARQSRAARAGCLDPLLPLLEAARLRLDPAGFPRLAGRFEGHAVEVRAVPDALGFRKLPALWLLVTLTEPQPLAGETRILLRPTGLEPFSTFAALPEEAPPPPGFPETAVLRTTARMHLPPAGVLAGLARLFADPALKEIVLGPAGLRLVRLGEEAPRGAYLLYREGELGRVPVVPDVVRPMLAALLLLARDLADACPAPRG